jgi:hypothetical protein
VKSHGDYNAGKGNLLTRPPELSGRSTSSHLWASMVNARKSKNFDCLVSEIPQRIFNMP